MANSTGYLYVAIGKRYLMEAEISARSLRRFTKYPLCLVTDDKNFRSELFDSVIYAETEGDFIAKIIGLQLTPFERTIYLDNDTFVCSSIDHLFSVLDLFDMAMAVENFMHSYSFANRYNPEFKIRYETVIPEYHAGVIVYKWHEPVKKLMRDWLCIHKEIHTKTDMLALREAVIENVHSVRISPLPLEYNYHGTHSFGFAYNEIKIIHERLGERWNTLTTVMLPYEKMVKIAKRMNRFKGKRIIVPYFGVIPCSYSPFRIKNKIKQWLGIKKTKKAETF
jgi:hypothetical protein